MDSLGGAGLPRRHRISNAIQGIRLLWGIHLLGAGFHAGAAIHARAAQACVSAHAQPQVRFKPEIRGHGVRSQGEIFAHHLRKNAISSTRMAGRWLAPRRLVELEQVPHSYEGGKRE